MEEERFIDLSSFCYYDESVNDDGGYFRATGMYYKKRSNKPSGFKRIFRVQMSTKDSHSE